MKITLDNFEHHVPFKIWQRGMDYYEDGAVVDLEEATPGEWTAMVEGTTDYYVELSLNGREVEAWSCDCPYDGGSICKHVVAMVLAVHDELDKVERTPFKIKVDTPKIVKPQIEEVGLGELMKCATPNDFQTFVMERIRLNPELKEELTAFLKTKYVESNRRDFGKEVEDIFKKGVKVVKYRGRWNRYDDGYEEIGWDKIFTKIHCLFEEVSSLIVSGEATPAIDSSVRFLQLLAKHHDESLLYDDDSDVYHVCEVAETLIKEAAAHASVSRERKENLLEELRQLSTNEALRDYDYCDIKELMLQVNVLVQSPDDSLRLIDKLLKERASSYDLHEYVERKIELLQGMGRKDEVRKVINKYLYLPEIRDREVDRLVEEKQYKEALWMLDEGIRIAKEDGHRGTELQWIQKKIEVYEKMDDKSSLIACNRLMFVRKGGSMEYYHKLKRSVDTSEWKLFLNKLIEDAKAESPYTMKQILPDIYVEEKEDGKLYDFLFTADRYDRLDLIQKYGLKLPPAYVSSILAVFVLELRDFAEKNMGRDYYARVAEMLHFMKRFKGGETLVQELLAEFKEKYKRRPAMMDELRRL